MKYPALQLIPIVCSLFFLLQCGSNKEGSDPEVKPTPTPLKSSDTTKTNLILFAGYTCPSCNRELPEIRDKLKTDFGDRTVLIKTQVYVIAGQNNTPSNEQVAKDYGQKLALPFEMLVDDHCKGGAYRTFYPEEEEERCLVPAAAIQNPDGSNRKIFPAGKLTIQALFNELQTRMK